MPARLHDSCPNCGVPIASHINFGIGNQMKRIVAAAFGIVLVAGQAYADGHASGDPEAGDKAFRKCKTCHSIVSADGDTIVKGGKTGPNLWGLPGRVAGTEENFTKYKKAIVEAGERGLAWNEDDFVIYAQDPQKFLRDYLDDNKARSGMVFKLKKEEEAADIWAFISANSPAPE